MVKFGYLGFSQRADLVPQSAFIYRADLFQQDDRVAAKTWNWSVQVHMGRKFMLTFPASQASFAIVLRFISRDTFKNLSNLIFFTFIIGIPPSKNYIFCA